MKKCVRCKTEKLLDDFNKDVRRPDGRHYYCRVCSHEVYAEWITINRKHNNERARDELRKLRLSVLNQYGGKCACCNEDRHEFLVIDHKYGGGNQDRKYNKENIYRRLRREGFPDSFQVLCQNCNSALGHYGYCPHKI